MPRPFSLLLALLVPMLLLSTAASAQSLSTVSSLFLSPGAETDFHLYGASGLSDRLNVTNQFNYSSVGTYDIGFALGDTFPLVPGTTYTLITFGSTNFTDASVFHPVVSTGSGGTGGLTTIAGNFTLLPANAASNTPGSLTFTLTHSTALPEPSTPALLLTGILAAPLMLWRRATPPPGRNKK